MLQEPARLDALQTTECVAWWTGTKAQLRDEAGQFLEARSAEPAVGDRPMFEPRANSNRWRYIQLWRHHDLPAARRRVTRMIKRLLQQRRWRVAYRRGSLIGRDQD